MTDALEAHEAPAPSGPARRSGPAAGAATVASDDAVPRATVFYDGACPLCRREIAFYRRRPGADRVDWVDVSETDGGDVAPGLSRASALGRFHVRDGDGRMVSGGAAFAALWSALPGFRIVGRVFRRRPLVWILEGGYRMFLKIRPRVQAMVAPALPRPESDYPKWLVGELRSDHAGETGAVAIYRGILALTRDAEIRDFAESHLETERRHLELMEDVLSAKGRSLLVPLWRLAGFLTGALPTLFGRNAVYATIDAVETFVDRHYAEQIDRLEREAIHADMRDLLERCRQDEVDHRDEARHAASQPPGMGIRLWCRLVASGSAAAVAVARRI